MAFWKAICIIIVVFTTIQLALGYKAAEKDKSSKKVLGHTTKSSKSRLRANASFEICFEICDVYGDCWVYYCPGDEICCTPGDPASFCCPASYPLCLPQGCFPVGYPELCGEYGKQYCPGEAPCCKQDGFESCCDKDAMGCCDGYGCVTPCESQFDAIGCQLLNLSLHARHWEESPPTAPTKLYRILRPDEQPNPGIVAKNPSAQKTVLSHVNCGSRPKYASQYISTSGSFGMTKYHKLIGEEKGLTGLRIAEIDVATLPESCTIVDLTTEANRDKYLENAVCKIYARKSEVVLLQCNVPIPCKVIDTPPEL